MRLSTKGRYAVTAMMDLHLHEGVGPVTLAELSERQHLSLSYLEQLFASIRRHGLVSGVRGPGGGYRLARGADRISVADIILAVDQPVDAKRVQEGQSDETGEHCVTHDLWEELSSQIQGFLGEITLANLAAEPALSLHRHEPQPDGGEGSLSPR